MGMAYQCAGKEAENILKVLDIREKGGYHREDVRLIFQDGSATDGIVYMAGPDNSDYLGEASTSDIAAQVNSARGPSVPAWPSAGEQLARSGVCYCSSWS